MKRNDGDLNSNSELTKLVNRLGINDFQELCHYVKGLPYGRNSNRSDFSLVVKEKCGSCSSKHAFLKTIADQNGLDEVELFIVMFKMNSINYPIIADILGEKQLKYIPEAHCIVKINGVFIDYTKVDSSFDDIKNDVLELFPIEAKQVLDFKINYHKAYIKKWIVEQALDYDFDEIWSLRESCIVRLSEN